MTTHPESEAAVPASDSNLLVTLAVLLVGLGAAAFTYLVVTPQYVIDDAFIGFRYARNLYESGELVFNLGENVEGYTSFLWVLISALAFPLGLEPIHFVQGVAMVAQFLTIILVFATGRRMGRSPSRCLLATVLVATHVGILAYPMTGMDTSLVTMLVTWSLFLLARGLDRWRDSLLLGIALSGIALTRFDGFVLVGMVLSYLLLFRARTLLRAAPAVLIFLAAMAAYHYWRLEIYGYDLVPNTAHAKVQFGRDRLVQGMVYLMKFFREGAYQFLVLVAIVPFLLGRVTPFIGLLGWVGMWQLAYTISVGGDWMPFFRFMLPVAPALLLLVQEGVWSARDVGAGREPSPLLGRFATFAMVTALLACSAVNLWHGAFGGYRRSEPFAYGLNGETFNHDDCEVIGKHIDEHFPKDWFLAMEWAGVIPFWAHQRTFDILGLNDGDATKKEYRDQFPSSQIGLMPTAEFMVEQKNPDLVVVSGKLYDTEEEALQWAEHRMRGGNEDRRGGRWSNGFYGVLDREPYQYRVVTTVIGGRYWPFLLRNDREVPVPAGG